MFFWNFMILSVSAVEFLRRQGCEKIFSCIILAPLKNILS